MLDTIAMDIGSRYVGLCRWDGSTLTVDKVERSDADRRMGTPHPAAGRPSPLAASGDELELIRQHWADWVARLSPGGAYQVVIRMASAEIQAAAARDLFAALGVRWVRMVTGKAARRAVPALVRRVIEHDRLRNSQVGEGSVATRSAARAGAALSMDTAAPLAFLEAGAEQWHTGLMDERGQVRAERHGLLSELGGDAEDWEMGLADAIGSCGARSGEPSVAGARALVAVGGRGPLLACTVAGACGLRRVLVPDYAGTAGAVGLLLADIDMEQRESFGGVAPDVRQLRQGFGRLMDQACRAVTMEGYDLDDTVCERFAVLSGPAGAPVEVSCEFLRDEPEFAERFREATGAGAAENPVVREIGLRVTITTNKPPLPARRWEGLDGERPLAGPAELRQSDTTILVPHGWHARRIGGAIAIVRG